MCKRARPLEGLGCAALEAGVFVGVSYAQSELVVCKCTEFTGVALHLGVFQGIVKILREALW